MYAYIIPIINFALRYNILENFVIINSSSSSGCTIRINGDLGQPQPVYLRNNNYMGADGNSGQVTLSTGENVVIACTGSGRIIQHPNIISTVSTAVSKILNRLKQGLIWLCVCTVL